MNKILDMHCDTISELYIRQEQGITAELRQNDLQLDLLRMRDAGYMLQTFAMFVNLRKEKRPYERCMRYIDLFYREMKKNKDLILPVTTVAQIAENERCEKMSALLSIEEGGVCQGSLEKLRLFYRLGVRMMTLTWNYENELAFPNQTRVGKGGTAERACGLTERGYAFLAEMERLGIIVDVSHLSDAGFYDVLHHTTKPFIASHSNARSVCGHVRNLTDDMIRKLAERGGVTGLNFYAGFTNEAKDGQESFGTIDALVQHARHIVNVGGIECLGLGTDYDGIEQNIELEECSEMPKLVDALKRASFRESEIDAICHGNVLRVMQDIIG